MKYRGSSVRGKDGLDVPHDKSPKSFHDDGCKCNGTAVIKDLFGTGTMMVTLKHFGMMTLLR